MAYFKNGSQLAVLLAVILVSTFVLSFCWCLQLSNHKVKWGQSVAVLGRGAWGSWSPPNLLYLTPWYYAWTIQNFINVLIFRVTTRTCYVKGMMKRQKSVYSKFI